MSRRSRSALPEGLGPVRTARLNMRSGPYHTVMRNHIELSKLLPTTPLIHVHPNEVTPVESGNPGGEAQTEDEDDDDDDDEYSDEDYDDDDDDDFDDASRPYNGDNPVLPAGPNRTTVGIEFEFLVAVARAHRNLEDPHPEDDRFLSDILTDYDAENPRFQVSVRNLVIDVLRNAGVAATKTKDEIELDLRPTINFGWTDSLLDQTDPNAAILNSWVGNFTWNPARSDDANFDDAVQRIVQQFTDFHINNNLEPRRTTGATIEALSRHRVPEFLTGVDNPSTLVGIASMFDFRARQYVEEQKRIYEDDITTQVDPNGVSPMGSDPKYRAWACTIDGSVSEYELTPNHYDIPPGSLLDPDSGFNPPFLYKWFPGELRTSILDYDHPDTRPAIQRACGALRNFFRIHKPSFTVGTGIHVHFGQEQGWTLYHLKKFTTLWILLEQSLEHLHRIDRAQNSGGSPYVNPLREYSPLAKTLLEGGFDRTYLSRVDNRSPARAARYRELMNRHVPMEHIPEGLRDFITEVWKYETVSALNRAMSGSSRTYGSVRFRVGGGKRTNTDGLQTLEVRLMQGTFDANHIWYWMTICRQMVHFARDVNSAQYYAGINDMFVGRRHPWEVLQIPREIMIWFNSRRGGDPSTGYFEYPDNDIVNWGDPFMVPGHGDTHGPPREDTN